MVWDLPAQVGSDFRTQKAHRKYTQCKSLYFWKNRIFSPLHVLAYSTFQNSLNLVKKGMFILE